MTTFVTGISFKTAPVHLREQLAVSPARLRCAGCQLKVHGGLSEVVLLSTCNRVEVYGVAENRNRIHSLLSTLSLGQADITEHVYVHENESAIEHLLSVTSGLDSMVLGETEITGQVKNAYQKAHEVGLTGRITNRLFQKALETAKAVRTKTHVQRGATSVGSVAVQLADKIFGNKLTEKTVMIIGAGKMGEACIRHLAKKGARSVIVSNRSIERAQELASELNGRAVRLDDSRSALVEADIIVSSTGCPHYILSRKDIEEVMAERRQRPLFLIDIAVPRDIDPAICALENVFLYNIDDLQEIVRENARLREQELAQCRVIIEEQMAKLMARFNSAPRKPVEKPAIQPAWGFCGAAPCSS